MKKPKILIYSDDLSEDVGYNWVKKNNLNFNFTFCRNGESLENINLNGFDAILIDYGLIDGDKYNLRRFIKSKTVLVWYGALADRSNGDAKRMFPEREFEYIHNLISANLSEIEWLLDTVFPEVNKVNK